MVWMIMLSNNTGFVYLRHYHLFSLTRDCTTTRFFWYSLVSALSLQNEGHKRIVQTNEIGMQWEWG